MNSKLLETNTVLYAASNPGGQPKIEQVPLPHPGDNQVIVKIEFVPINPLDIAIIQGIRKFVPKTPHPTGLEGSGTIVAIGTNLKKAHKVGDRVHVLAFGTLAHYQVIESENCYPIHGDLPFDEAASHTVNPGTVYYFGLKAEEGGHKAAIHTVGSSALGKMLIRYFKRKGITLINIVRQDKYIEELKKEGADYVLNSQAPDFEAQLKELAAKENATIAFDAICGEFTAKILRLQPRDSTICVYGGLGGNDITGLTVMDLIGEKSVQSLSLFDLLGELRKKGELDKFFEEIHPLLSTVFKTNVQKVFKLEEINEALAYSKENSAKGKILVKPY